MTDDVVCYCEMCGEEVVVENFANLSEEELCLGIICEEYADKIEYEEDYGEDEE